jgi:hypothetical protein
MQGAATAYAAQQAMAAEDAIAAASEAAQAAATAQADANAAAAKAKNTKWVTPILDVCNVMHMSLNLLNGFNAPNKGDSLGGAADKLALAAKDLELAANTSGWAGDDGEPTYTDANKAQLARVKSMAGIDKAFKEVLTTQAEDVLDLREVFGYVTGSFAIWKPILGALSLQGEAQKAASSSWAPHQRSASPLWSFTKTGGGYTNNQITLWANANAGQTIIHQVDNFNVTSVIAVPEPGSLTIVGTALFGFVAYARRKRMTPA